MHRIIHRMRSKKIDWFLYQRNGTHHNHAWETIIFHTKSHELNIMSSENLNATSLLENKQVRGSNRSHQRSTWCNRTKKRSSKCLVTRKVHFRRPSNLKSTQNDSSAASLKFQKVSFGAESAEKLEQSEQFILSVHLEHQQFWKISEQVGQLEHIMLVNPATVRSLWRVGFGWLRYEERVWNEPNKRLLILAMVRLGFVHVAVKYKYKGFHTCIPEFWLNHG